ncbi:hypothetical protein RND71_009489 [Anisodus tanguticus]|uniref:Uncharacterized protein n=1 Tax=Anisodus tanguticus TaxID=243964 RepID=A0AAE1VR92_9SOLA|nr:hypothetical protein RND71_009489 [Anisodus tanguticus]
MGKRHYLANKNLFGPFLGLMQRIGLSAQTIAKASPSVQSLREIKLFLGGQFLLGYVTITLSWLHMMSRVRSARLKGKVKELNNPFYATEIANK